MRWANNILHSQNVNRPSAKVEKSDWVSKSKHIFEREKNVAVKERFSF